MWGDEPEEKVHTTEAAGSILSSEIVPVKRQEAEQEEEGRGPAPANLPPCPLLLLGQGFQKVFPLAPELQCRIGRHHQANILLKNNGVSRNHCMVVYDKRRKTVELRDSSEKGTLVNGERIKRCSIELKHCDRIRVEGNLSKHYDFLLDLRPIEMGWNDPRMEAEDRKVARRRQAVTNPKKRRPELQKQLKGLEGKLKSYDSRITNSERQLSEIEKRMEKRQTQDKQQEEKCQKLVEDKVELENRLLQSREAWKHKLVQQSELNEQSSVNLISQVKALQDKLHNLQLHKDTLERTIHPERFAVVDLGPSHQIEDGRVSEQQPGNPDEGEEVADFGDFKATAVEAAAPQDAAEVEEASHGVEEEDEDGPLLKKARSA